MTSLGTFKMLVNNSKQRLIKIELSVIRETVEVVKMNNYFEKEIPSPEVFRYSLT